MTPEQLKELYATGEWIFLYKTMGYGWQKCTNAKLQEDAKYKLIHKKHSEVLDHVLNGGAVEIKLEKVTVVKETVEEFISTYKESFNYEIIKDKPQTETNSIHENEKAICCAKCGACEEECICHKPSLDGHYCLATKEHYGKLVKDGCIGHELDFHEDYKYIVIDDNETLFWNIEPTNAKPMHLHNNEWIIGSLEHEEINPSEWQWKTITDTDAYYTDCKTPPDFNSSVFVYRRKPKVERITREEAYKRTGCDLIRTLEGNELAQATRVKVVLDELLARLEYLEANQKDK